MSSNELAAEASSSGMGVFEGYLSVWVALAIIAGVALGHNPHRLFSSARA